MNAAITAHYEDRPCLRSAQPEDLPSGTLVAIWDQGAWQYAGVVVDGPHANGAYRVSVYGVVYYTQRAEDDLPLLAVYTSNPESASCPPSDVLPSPPLTVGPPRSPSG